MSTDLQSGSMMIRQGFLLPDSAQLKSRSYSKTWRSMVGLDNFALARELSAAGWHLFFLAGESKVIELGWGASPVRRGIKRILTGGRKLNLNCMQIKKVTSSHFLGIPYAAVHACCFHIQKDAVLKSSAERKLEQQDGDWACG